MTGPILDQINVSDYEIREAREGFFRGFGALDAKRPNAWKQYGYPDTVEFSQLLTAYQRGGPGHGAVHRLLDKCWQEAPRIKRPDDDDESTWEEGVQKVLTAVHAFKKLKDLDRRNMVGRYAALIYRVGDGKTLRDPLGAAQKLVDLVPVYEDQIKVIQWQSDQQAENFGQPLMYQYRTRAIAAAGADTQGRPETWTDVHPSRVQILAEGSVGDMFDGVPLLLAGFNHLIDLEKIAGGSAESFLKNSARTVVFEYDPQATPQAIQQADGSTQSVREVHEEQTRRLNKNQDSSIVMQGGKAATLSTVVSDPGPSFEVAANLFAASVQIPFTVLFGQQTGRLASDEDKADMVARCKARQQTELTPMLEELVKRLQAAGLIEAGEFEIEWPPLDSPGDAEKADLLTKYTAAMKQAGEAGLMEPLFDQNELRGVVDFEERDNDGMPTAADLAAAAALEQAALAGKTAPGAPAPAPKNPTTAKA